ncbi:MAG: hypothetical protein C4534_08910 [Gaiellales bacterium]|nr:MAG: hypothetical protein C4534_08910 [Gaiellales bacterium]
MEAEATARQAGGKSRAAAALHWLSLNRVLAALLLLALTKCLLWTIAIPPWRTPDEPQHFGYIQYLSRERSIPLSGETYFYPDTFESMTRTNFGGILSGAESSWYDPGQEKLNPAAGHPPLYYMSMLPAYWLSGGGGIETQLYAVRLAGAVFFLLLVAVSYRFARLLFPDAVHMQIGVPLLIILHPQLGFISAGVMNDSLAVLLFTYFLYRLVLFTREDGVSLRSALVMGAVAGLGMLTRTSFSLAYPVGFIVLAVMLARRRGERARLLQAAGLMLGVSLLICGWYFLRNYLELGYLQPAGKVERYGAAGLWELIWATRFRGDLITSFLGNFSWMSIPLPLDVMLWFRRAGEVAIGGLVVGGAVGLWRRGWELMRPWLVLFFALIIAAFVLSVAYFELNVGGAQGRYLFLAIFPFWTLFLAGLCGWFPPSWRPRVATLVLLAAGIFSAWVFTDEFIGRVL